MFWTAKSSLPLYWSGWSPLTSLNLTDLIRSLALHPCGRQRLFLSLTDPNWWQWPRMERHCHHAGFASPSLCFFKSFKSKRVKTPRSGESSCSTCLLDHGLHCVHPPQHVVPRAKLPAESPGMTLPMPTRLSLPTSCTKRRVLKLCACFKDGAFRLVPSPLTTLQAKDPGLQLSKEV